MASVLVDFYNLHLARGVRNELLPSEDEQQRIRKFFEIHVPDVIKKLTEEEKQKIHELQPQWQNIHPGTISVEIGNYPELKKLATLEGYEILNGSSWFFSKGFQLFVKKYCHIKNLMDGWLWNGTIALESLKWLQELQRSYFATVMLQNKNSSQVSTVDSLMAQNESHISIDEYAIYWNIKNINFSEGIRLTSLFFEIFNELVLVLMGKSNIKKCAAKETPNTLACPNFFSPKRKGALYCSKRCNNRVSQAKLNDERKKAMFGVHKRGRKKMSISRKNAKKRNNGL